ALVEAVKTLLMVDGTASLSFSAAIANHSYYIVITHRSTIQTWSSAPYAFAPTGNSYNFTTAASQAYGSNQKQVDSAPNYYALYSGDINQDQNVDLIDFPPLDFGIN